MTCKLCGKNNKLEYSHIIPSSFHKDTKNIGKNLKIVTPPNNGIKRNQTDLAEFMLCGKCEDLISETENLAIPALKNISNGVNGRIDKNITEVVERFVRSVFWRASVSSVCKYKLSKNNEDLLRDFLLGIKEINKNIFLTEVSMLMPLKDLKKGNGGLIIEPWSDFEIYGIADHFVVGGIVCSMIWDSSNIRENEANLIINNQEYLVKKSTKNVDLKVEDLLIKIRTEGLNPKYKNIF